MYELLTIDVTKSTPNGLGKFTYKYFPHIGEWLEIDINDIGHMYEIVMVAHSSRGSGSDVFVKHLGLSTKMKHSLCVETS